MRGAACSPCRGCLNPKETGILAGRRQLGRRPCSCSLVGFPGPSRTHGSAVFASLVRPAAGGAGGAGVSEHGFSSGQRQFVSTSTTADTASKRVSNPTSRAQQRSLPLQTETSSHSRRTQGERARWPPMRPAWWRRDVQDQCGPPPPPPPPSPLLRRHPFWGAGPGCHASQDVRHPNPGEAAAQQPKGHPGAGGYRPAQPG